VDLLVGVDLGTTACKVTVVASDLTASSSISSPPYPIAAPHREWAEQDPHAWGEAVDTTVRRALDSVGAGSRDHVTLSILPSASSSVPLTPASGNASARGAALLAGVGIGLFDIDDLPSITLGATAYPDPHTVDWYTQQRQTYRDPYRVLKPFNQRLEVGHPTKGESSYASPGARRS
jgi:sugar (pentulose or hexulose) kinase